MRPSRLFLQILFAFAVAAIGVGLLRLYGDSDIASIVTDVWWWALAIFLLLTLLDGIWRNTKAISAERMVPGSFAVGVGNKVSIQIANSATSKRWVTVFDHYPDQIQTQGLPITVSVAPQLATEINYWAHPSKRGDARFGAIDCRIRSRFGLWQFQVRFDAQQKVNVYPNFTAITLFEQLGQGQQMNQLGIHLMQRRGQGMDFHQLREYRDGDTSRQIDWKASSRVQKIISRDYQDERDQDIVFLLDCGRRMRTKDDELSHFDHCLNSLLLVSYVALKQGDAVGFLSFAGTHRWLSPIKGQTSINVILNSVYDLHSSTETSDMVEAATELMTRHRKRALVIVLTNVREEDREDLVAATRLLGQKHLVMVASLREKFMDEVIETPVQDFEAGLVYSQTTKILAERRKLLEYLRNKGVVIADSIPQKMHIQLVNEYWALKRSGKI